jgi:tRNA-2-methylthio-N6-dimethylallyladenosine synthase
VEEVENLSQAKDKRYFLETYGCQMNEYDSSLVAELLAERGYSPTSDPGQAQLILVNTCSVRDKAEETALEKLRSIAHHRRRDPSVRMGVLGCMAENRKETILERVPEVDILLGPDHYDRLGDLLDRPEQKLSSALGPDIAQTYEGLFAAAPAGVQAFVAVQRGCDMKCSYCIVPTTRGPERSRPLRDVLEETRRLVDKGVVEIMLLGQTVNAYRADDGNFGELLVALDKIPGLRRVRFMSPHPRYFTDNLCRTMADLPSVCRHMHIPLQSGSSRVLRSMRRQYSRDQFLRIVERLREHLPDVALTTDLIAGYPGETRDEHLETLSALEAVRFDAAYMFAYSPRPGTLSADMVETITETEKQARLAEIIELQRKHTYQRLDEAVGSVEDVLLEGASRRNGQEWIGKTTHFRKVVLDPGSDARAGQIVSTRISARRGQILWGERA